MKLYFAGVNTAWLAGSTITRPVLVSYADIVRRPGVWEMEIYPRLVGGWYDGAILDSGAFTELQDPNFHVDVHEYAEFAAEHQQWFNFVVNLDDIRGDIDRTNRNQRVLEAAGVAALPVYHQGEPLRQLDHVLDGRAYIGVGFQRPIKGARRFLDEFFEQVDGRAKVHGFAMSRYAREYGYPFESVDSTTWMVEAWAMSRGHPKQVSVPRRKGGGSQGHAGRAALWLWNLGAQARTQLVLDSYEGKASEFFPYDEAGGVPDWEWLIPVADELLSAENHLLIGQARTVLHRFDRNELARSLWQARAMTSYQAGERSLDGGPE